MIRHTLEVETGGRGFCEITGRLRELVGEARSGQGLCHCFIHHTSASLIIMENADPAVLRDLERFMGGLVRDGDPRFEHTAEGPDDMSAHIRSVLTHTHLVLPVADGTLDLGTWQGVFVWEHRAAPHTRRVSVTIDLAQEMGGA